MKLGIPCEWATTRAQSVFSESRPNAVFKALLYGALALLFGGLSPFALNRMAAAVMLVAGVGFGIASFRAMLRARATFEPYNWLIRVILEGLLLQFRPLMRRISDDEGQSVVLIDRSEIVSVGKRVEKRYHATSDPELKGIVRESFLEIRLSNGKTEALAKAMRREQNACPHDVTIWLAKPDLIRVAFAERHIRPGLDTALKILGRHFPTVAAVYFDLKDWRTLNAREARAYADTMCDRGSDSEASVVLQDRAGYDRGTASQYITSRRRRLAGL